jgi:hypothetical protein
MTSSVSKSIAAILLLFAIIPAALGGEPPAVKVPELWEYSGPLISPEIREVEPSRAQKDPTVVFFEGKWHVFMTVKLPERSAIEYCSFEHWEDANNATRYSIDVSTSDYFCAPQVFYFEPHEKWYLLYQMGVPGSRFMHVAYSTTEDISDPDSWTQARPMLDGGENDPRVEGGLDYWIICDEAKAYLFLTNLRGKMWRLSTDLAQFPQGFGDCELALQAKIFEASHIYKVEGSDQYLAIIEENGRRYLKAYLADRLDGEWSPLADTADAPFAGWKNVRPASGIEEWTDNISHGELIRTNVNQTPTIDPGNLCLLFQGMFDAHKSGRAYGQFQWRLGLLQPVDEE